MAILGSQFKRLCESQGRDTALATVRAAIDAKKIRYEQGHVSIKELAESICGHDWHRILRARFVGGNGFRESAEAVDASSFSDITGQLLIEKAHEQYQAADFVLRDLPAQEQITNGNLGPQREPWLSKLTTGPSRVNQGMEYPAGFFTENYIDMPAPEKWGEICRVTFEMVFSDLTRQVFDSAGNVGERIGIWQEEQAAAVIFGQTFVIDGVSVNGNNHSWNGSSYNTYQTSAPWVNQISALQILDWTQINQVEQIWVNMLDPQTGKPIKVKPTAAVVQPFKLNYWKRIRNATNTRQGDYPTSGATNTLTDAPSPLDGEYPFVASPYAYQLLLQNMSASQAQEQVVVADFKRAFLWRYVWPMTVVEAPAKSPEEFKSDIVYQIRGSIFGKYCVYDPRRSMNAFNT